jgi:transposase
VSRASRGLLRQGLRFPRTELPSIVAKRSDALSPPMIRLIKDLTGDWRWPDERTEGLSTDMTSLVEQASAV